MLNFVSDPEALVLVKMESPLMAGSTSVEVSFETYEPRLHAMSGIQIVNPLRSKVRVDFSGMLAA